jgi:phosphoenolpyruvate---glycerone phosphotransferase subunit DhaK
VQVGGSAAFLLGHSHERLPAGGPALKKLINDVDAILAQSLGGFGRAHADLVTVNLEPAFIRRKAPTRPGKVALISGGGSGHEPMHGGYVGMGMLDAACPGQVFTSPTPDQMLAATEAVDSGAGVLFIVKNYEGDVMNFDMASEMATGKSARVLTNDDVAVENSSFTTGRRGVAGTVVVEKIVGAAAEAGMDLAGLEALGNKVNDATRSMGAALTSCTVPAAGGPTFQIGDDEMEMGVGIHGEPGRKRVKLPPASAIVEEMMQAILGDLGPGKGDDVLLLVNGFGATPLMELYLVYDEARTRAEAAGLTVARTLVGNWCTSLDMAGCSLTVTRLDAETTGYWDAPVHTPALRWGC